MTRVATRGRLTGLLKDHVSATSMLPARGVLPMPGAGRIGHIAAAAVVTLAAAGMLAGCVTQPQKMASATSRASVSTEYQGRFAVHYADQTGQIRDAYGNFDWVEQADAVTLSLRNPLGNTLAIVVATPTTASLELPNQAPRTADNVEDLMQSSLGFPMPVSGLRYWLRNEPAPGSHAKTSEDASGRITQIVQDGWQIDYLGFAEAPTSPASPAGGASAAAGMPTKTVTAPRRLVSRMNLVRLNAPASSPLAVKLVINP